jgi:hypothetical protein
MISAIGTAINSFTAATAGQYVTLDVTSLVQSWITTPASNFGFALSASAANVLLDSKENDETGPYGQARRYDHRDRGNRRDRCHGSHGRDRSAGPGAICKARPGCRVPWVQPGPQGRLGQSELLRIGLRAPPTRMANDYPD